jgi:protein-tyrosine-phosphatase
MMERYIKTRIEQLVDDMNRASNEHDKQWYNRLIQELDWVLMMDGKKPKRNCSIDDATPEEWDKSSRSIRWTQDMSGTGQYVYGEYKYTNE